MIRKRGTRKLKELGFKHLEIHKGMWGFYALDNRFFGQKGTFCRKTQDEVIKDIQNGKRPIKLKAIR